MTMTDKLTIPPLTSASIVNGNSDFILSAHPKYSGYNEIFAPKEEILKVIKEALEEIQ